MYEPPRGVEEGYGLLQVAVPQWASDAGVGGGVGVECRILGCCWRMRVTSPLLRGKALTLCGLRAALLQEC